jgi:hypothetical protein
MKRRRLPATLLIAAGRGLAVLIALNTAFGQSLSPGQADATQSDDGGRNVVLIYGFRQTFHPRADDTAPRMQRGPVSFSIDVTSWLNLSIGNDTFISAKAPGLNRVTGVGDTSITVATALVDEETCPPPVIARNAEEAKEETKACKRHPSFGLTYYGKFPSASAAKGLGTGRTDHSVLGIITKTLGQTKNSIEVDFGAYFAGRTDRGGFANSGLLNLMFNRTLDRRDKANWSFHSEVDASTPSEGNPSEIYMLNDISYAISPHFSLKAGTQVGLTSNSPRFGFYGSITISGKFGQHKNKGL